MSVIRGRAGCAGVLLLAACAQESRFVAVEPETGADIRVVAAIDSNGGRSLTALTRDQAYTYQLKDLFDAEASLEVYVFAFELGGLVAAYPGLRNLEPAAVVAALAPTFGTPGPGGYDVPATKDERVYAAHLDRNSAGEIAYESKNFAEVMADDNVRFVFRMTADFACPPGQGGLRAFNPAEVSRVCALERNEDCEWASVTACDNLPEIFQRDTEPVLFVREIPPSSLEVRPVNTTCTEVQRDTNGESRAYSCNSTRVAVQNTARGRGGPWLLSSLQLNELRGSDPRFARAKEGAIYAVQSDTRAELRRLGINDAGLGDQPLRVQTQSGYFDIFLAAIGTLQEVSTDASGDFLVVSGTDRAYALERNTEPDANPVERFIYYFQPVSIPAAELPPANRRGPVISGPGQAIYALIDNGIAVLEHAEGVVNHVRETQPGVVMFTNTQSPRLAAVRKTNEDRVIVWTNTGDVYVFDRNGGLVLGGCQLGEVLAVIDGPHVFRRSAGDPFVIERINLADMEAAQSCDPGEVETYLVPPSDNDATGLALTLLSGSYLSHEGRESIAYAYGNYGGVLDLGSGLSTATELRAPASNGIVLAGASGSRQLAVFGTVGSAVADLFQLPIFEGE